MKIVILLCVIAAAPAAFGIECGVNQHYEECGTACPLKCENYRYPPQECNMKCRPGCHCDQGYVESYYGGCFKPEKCPPYEVCGEHEDYNECKSNSDLTCDNYENPSERLDLLCLISCECKEGFVRNSDYRCVKPEDCPLKARSAQSCMGAADPGKCEAYTRMWYYDSRTGTCQKFIYGGCEGNGNRYTTKEKCLKNCAGVRIQETRADRCQLPSESGSCLAYIPRYFYDSSSRECKEFIYGGCGGNENNFKTLEECRKSCAE